MHYYPHHIGDYQRDTGHLSILEHGAYRLLMDAYYVTERPLPSNFDALFRLVRAISKAERDAVKSVVGSFFQTDGDTIRHKRADEEIALYHAKSEKAANAGRLSGKARKEKRALNGRSTDVQPETNGRSTGVEPTNIQYPISNNQYPEDEYISDVVSLEIALATATTTGIPPEVIRAWWFSRSSVGWMFNGSRIVNWRPNLQSYWVKCQNNEAKEKKEKAEREAKEKERRNNSQSTWRTDKIG